MNSFRNVYSLTSEQHRPFPELFFHSPPPPYKRIPVEGKTENKQGNPAIGKINSEIPPIRMSSTY